jgi:hypothetical protein
MSRREALRAGAATVIGAAALTPGDAWARLSGSCPDGRVRCRATCCPKGEVCLGSGTHRHCGCPHHEARCSGRCVNLGTSFSNCGRCGHACRTGQHCSGGRCLCPAGDTLCAGTCVPLAHDPKNCGSCTHACATHQVCSNGHCLTTCANGETNCNNACVDLQTNVHNCGSCGHACTTGDTCVNGSCVQCGTASDCPGQDTACQTRTCVSGTCGVSYAAVDTACGAGGAMCCD